MIVETTTGPKQFEGASFETDEHNNLCVFVNQRCTRVFNASVWTYVELET
jgi:hypothetical protein